MVYNDDNSVISMGMMSYIVDKMYMYIIFAYVYVLNAIGLAETQKGVIC